MKYIALIYETPADFASRQKGKERHYVAAWRAYHKAIVDAGVYISGAPLKDVTTSTTIRVQDGKRRVQDGPFAEAKEQLGGFMILDLPSLDAALDWAARCPAAATGAIEVRPMDVELFESVEKP
jgi:hypothetical protein